MLRNTCCLNRTTSELIGKFDRFPGQDNIVETDRKFDGSAIDNRSLHADDVGDMLRDGSGLIFGVASI